MEFDGFRVVGRVGYGCGDGERGVWKVEEEFDILFGNVLFIWLYFFFVWLVWDEV